MKCARSLLRFQTLLITLAAILVAAVTARSAPLTDTEKAIIAVLLGNKSSFYSVGGTVTYLANGKTLALQLNGSSNLSVSSNGSFSFSEDVMGGDNYQVTVLTQPSGQTCTVLNASGTAEDDIKNVAVTCDSNTNYAAVIRGRTIDGYIQGATVFLDINGNSTLDGDEPSATSGEGGRFEIGLNEEQAACKALAPVVADVPVGAIDETEGEVTEAYQMALPPGTDAIQSGTEVNITPLTSILWAELFALYSNGALPGISCAELENNTAAQEELQRKIDETIANAVRAYNVPEADLLSDYMASGATNTQRTAEDIVTGLKWSLREKIRLEQLYGDSSGVRVVIKRLSGAEANDSSANSQDYGWYREWSLTEENLVREGTSRLSDDLKSELYIVFYKERYPWTTSSTGIQYRYLRSISRTPENPTHSYKCTGQEFVRLEDTYADGKGRMEYDVENITAKDVDGFEACGPDVHETTLNAQNWFVTEWTYGRADGIFKEQGYYAFSGAAAPLPAMQGVANDPDRLVAGEVRAVMSNFSWRFPLPASNLADGESKHLETDGQQLVIEKFHPMGPPNGNWRKLENFEDGTSAELWANAPYDTPEQCIDWKGNGSPSPASDVLGSCSELQRHELTTVVAGDGKIIPSGSYQIPEGDRFRMTFASNAGSKLVDYSSDCGGALHGTTFVTDPIFGDCSVNATFESSGGEEPSQCDSESWQQLGTDLLGEQVPAGDGDGAWSTGMNAMGTIVAEGARYNDHGGDYSGQVRVYQWSGASWIQIGADIYGAAGEQMGYDVALDDAGDTLVVGAPYCSRDGCTGGYARVYDFDGANWIQRGEDIVGLDSGDREGWAVDITADGSRVLTLSERGANEELTRASRLRIFDWDGSGWQKVANTMYGPTEYSYPRVARLSPDGSHIVAGYWSASVDSYKSGEVTVRRLNNNGWEQVGQSINGTPTGAFSRVGVGVALSEDSQTMALGTLQGLGIFDLNGNTWVQRGDTIKGPDELSSELGWGIELRDSGNTVVASTVEGLVGVWDWKDNQWLQVGNWMGYGARGARDVGASADGSKVVVAQQGFNARQGRLQVYELVGCP